MKKKQKLIGELIHVKFKEKFPLKNIFELKY